METIITTPILLKDLGMEYPTETSKQKSRYGLYKCGCGVEFKTRIGRVKNGTTVSCGCYRIEQKTTHGLHNHPLYVVWSDMIRRTTNSKIKCFKYYGGRGITVCERWLNVSNFIEDMYTTYQEGLTIDRIDNNKGYSKENCRFVTRNIQSRNTIVIRSNNTSGYRGVSYYKSRDKWTAKITVNNKLIHLGYFKTALDAAIAYDRYVLENNFEHTLNGVC